MKECSCGICSQGPKEGFSCPHVNYEGYINADWEDENYHWIYENGEWTKFSKEKEQKNDFSNNTNN